jgi:hypothetical protein
VHIELVSRESNMTNQTSTESNITRSQIRALSNEAAEHGDLEQVALCDAALAGDADAIRACERTIRDAVAQGSFGPQG